MADEDELGAVGDGVGGGRPLGPELAGVVAAEPLGVGPVDHGEVEGGVDPPSALGDVMLCSSIRSIRRRRIR
mgnify:CR=1 FL=1